MTWPTDNPEKIKDYLTPAISYAVKDTGCDVELIVKEEKLLISVRLGEKESLRELFPNRTSYLQNFLPWIVEMAKEVRS